MHFVSRRIACFCDKVFDTDVADSADLGAEPDVEKQIESGDFMAVRAHRDVRAAEQVHHRAVGGIAVIGKPVSLMGVHGNPPIMNPLPFPVMNEP